MSVDSFDRRRAGFDRIAAGFGQALAGFFDAARFDRSRTVLDRCQP